MGLTAAKSVDAVPSTIHKDSLSFWGLRFCIEVWIGDTALSGANWGRNSGITVDPLGPESSGFANPFFDYSYNQVELPRRTPVRY